MFDISFKYYLIYFFVILQSGLFAKEIVGVKIPGKKGKPDVLVDTDEEFNRVKFDKVPQLPTVFQKENGIVQFFKPNTIYREMNKYFGQALKIFTVFNYYICYFTFIPITVPIDKHAFI